MKRFLVFGLLLGVVLGSVVWRNTRLGVPPPSQKSTVFPQTDADQIRHKAIVHKQPMPTPRPGATPPTPWAAIESEDLPRFVANLREVGCPERTIRDLVTFRICRHYYGLQLEAEAQAQRSWDYSGFNGSLAETQKLRSELRNARDQELEALLGVNAEKLIGTVLVGQFESVGEDDFLPLAKRAQVRGLEERYRRLIDQAKLGLLSWDEPDPAVDAAVKELGLQKEAELAALLTPQELGALHLRESPAARYVREHLPEAQSEAEFRLMVQAVEEVGVEPPKMPFAGIYVPPSIFGPDPEDEDRKQTEKQARLADRLEDLLGAKRAAELGFQGKNRSQN